MIQSDSAPASAASRRHARDLIAAVLENMRHNLEPLRYSTLAPSRYVIYVHASEFARLEGIIPVLRAETVRALDEELHRLNRRTALDRYRARLFGDDMPPVQAAGGEWQVEFLPDANGEIAEGDILIDSELVLPALPELGTGERTRRISTVHAGQRTTVRQPAIAAPAAVPPPPRPFAVITYEDQSGRHTYDVHKDVVTIGRGGASAVVDIPIVSSVDVSREHARIRRDAVSGRFFLVDVSSLGTTLNGRHVPRGYDEVHGGKQVNGAETPLPDEARVGLAETIFLDFRVLPR